MIFYRWLVLVLVTLLCTAVVGAQDLNGVVVDQQGAPLAGVFVSIDERWQTLTNNQGQFSFHEIPEGNHKLDATYLGFSTYSSDIVVQGSSSISVDIELIETIMGLPEVVVKSVSLTGGLRGLKDVPGSAHYISPREMERFSYTDINRVLRAVPGINLQEEDGFGLRPNIGLRGTGSERSSKITIMEDGILAAPAPYSAPAAYYFPTIGRMNAVEVLKGSSQIRFGPHTTGGAINLISTPIPDRFTGELHFTAGSFGNRNIHAYAGNSHRNIGYLVETFQYQSDGFKQMSQGETGFDKKDYLIKFRVHSNPEAKRYQSLSIKLAQSDESSQETYLGLTSSDFRQSPHLRYAGSQNDEMNSQHRQYALQHIVQLSKSIDITTHLYRNDFHRNWYKLDKVADQTGNYSSISQIVANPDQQSEGLAIIKGQNSAANALLVKANNRTYRSQGIQTTLGFDFQTGHVKHRTDVGIRYHQDEVDRFQWVDGYAMVDEVMQLTSSGTPGTESNRLENANAWAAHIQHKAGLGRLSLIPGLRYENISMYRSDFGKQDPERLGSELSTRENHVDVWIPGLGIDFKVDPSLTLIAGVHKGFSPPGTKDGTRPEESLNYELGFRYHTKMIKSQLIGFVSQYDNLLGSDLAAAGGSGSNDLFNGGSVSTKGVEMQMTYDPLGNNEHLQLPLTIVYTWTDAHFKSSFDSEFEGWGSVEQGDALPYLAKHQFTVTGSLHSRNLSLNLSTRYQSDVLTAPGTFDDTSSTLKGQAITDFNTTYSVNSNFAIYLNASNVFNKAYAVAARPAGLRPGLPRNLMAGVKVRF